MSMSIPPLSLAVAVLVAMAGCSGSESNGLLTRSLPSEGEMTAIVGGTLDIDPDQGCILLSGKPAIWPAGTTLATDPLEFRLPTGLVLRPGDTVTGGGGEVPGNAIQETALRIEGDVTEALSCAPGSEVVVFWARGGDIRVGTRG